jgi:FRG domain
MRRNPGDQPAVAVATRRPGSKARSTELEYTRAMPWNEEVVERWQDFEPVVERATERIGQGLILYRGQTDSSWRLRPSLLRGIAEADTREAAERLHEVEKASVYRFRQQSHHHLKASVLPPDLEDLEGFHVYVKWLTLMQHYSAPTRLLDWSASPFVALYFAVEDTGPEDGAVWFFDVSSVDAYYAAKTNALQEKQPIDYTKLKRDLLLQKEPVEQLYCVQTKLLSEREIAQQGSFTLSRDVTRCHDDLIWNACQREGKQAPACGKLVIPAAKKPEILGRLRRLNVSASTLFPGADGLGRALRDEIRAAFMKV